MTAAPTGAVYDRGYRPYDGERLGRRGARVALFRASVRRALGFGRAWRQKVLPWGLLVIAVIPAIVNVGVGYVARNTPVEGFEWFTFREYVGVSTALLVFVGVVAPDLVCPDRRYRTLSLILSRPLTGIDYALAKVAAVVTIVFAFGFVPQVVLFVGRMLVTDDGALEYFTENADVLWKVPVSVLLLAVYMSAIGVALASLTTRRVLASAMFLGGVLLSSSVSGILQGEPPREPGYGELFNLLTIPLKLRDVVFLGELADDTSLSGATNGAAYAAVIYVAVLVIAMWVLVSRYRNVDA